MGITGPTSIEECLTCKSPTKEISRSLCTTCLNRNLQWACETTAVLAASRPRISRSVPRALFPGMPRAVLRPVNLEKGHHVSPPCCRATLTAGNYVAPSLGVRNPDCKSEAAAPRDASEVNGSQKVESADEKAAKGWSFAAGELQTESQFEEKGSDIATEKWHLFQLQKNLTVKIPNPPMDISKLPGRWQPLIVLAAKEHSHNSPLRKEVRSRAVVRPTKLKRSSIKTNADAEAELMMRLLSDSIPMLKSTAPLVLPPCKIRPAPMSPLSPPGDPLWKRRCIPCPTSLKVQITSICVR